MGWIPKKIFDHPIMEEPVPERFAFMCLLESADKHGAVRLQESHAQKLAREIDCLCAKRFIQRLADHLVIPDYPWFGIPAHLSARFRATVSARSPGFVYLMAGSCGLYKIGMSNNPTRRVREVQMESPWRVMLLHQWAVSEMLSAERVLHEKFAAKRVRGEWFALDASEVDYLKNLA